MASISCHAFFYPIRCSSNKDNDLNMQKVNSIKINGSSPMSTFKTEVPNQSTGLAAATYSTLASVVKTDCDPKMKNAIQNIPSKKQLVDPFRQGIIIEGGVGYRQTIVVRSYEVGADKTSTLESLLNLLQETALNHVWMSGLLGNGFGATHGMLRNNLIWVVTKMQVQVDSYPIWGEIVEIDTWVGASGKNGMRRDWLIRNHTTGHTIARATSTWVMMNQQTRRLSKMPEEVRDEIAPWFINKQAIPEEECEKIIKLDDHAKYIHSDLKPKRNDLDMNHHVNNVKYVRWMLETIPDIILESHQLSSIILEYRRECGSSDLVESLCQPDEDDILEKVEDLNEMNVLNGFALESNILDNPTLHKYYGQRSLRYVKNRFAFYNENNERGKPCFLGPGSLRRGC